MHIGKAFRCALPRNGFPMMPFGNRTPYRCWPQCSVVWRTFNIVPPTTPHVIMQWQPTDPSYYGNRTFSQSGGLFFEEWLTIDPDDNGGWDFYWQLSDSSGFSFNRWRFPWDNAGQTFWGFGGFPFGPPTEQEWAGDFGSIFWENAVPVGYSDEP